MISLTARIVIPLRGDIWLVDFGPKVGDEMQKVRPAVVVSADSAGALKLKLVAPISEWKDKFKFT